MARAPAKTAPPAPIRSKPQIPPLNTSMAGIPTIAPPVAPPLPPSAPVPPPKRARQAAAKKAPAKKAAPAKRAKAKA